MNIQQMVKQAQALQAKMSKAQEELKTKEETGSSRGGKVKITINGAQEVVAVVIDPGVVNQDEVDLLEDLVLTAFKDAHSKVAKLIEAEMGKVTGGAGLPPGLF
jgi:DNA-binding YbaB/EbfC family protein